MISFLVLFMLSAVLFMGATKWNKEITAENLKIVDEKGNTRIEVSTDVEEHQQLASSTLKGKEDWQWVFLKTQCRKLSSLILTKK